jgi:hypothetical protein
MDTQVCAVDGEIVCRRNRVILAVLERAILNQLGVDASITRVVDVLHNNQYRHFLLRAIAYLVKEAISIRMAKLAGDIASG